ncbi:hypothetical protein [Larkinella soli]|uniref:hypothetical protein n=1 Tax=Larkinella soli TaxID=1770527 RepID=UPI000FFC42D0|nr:hypothetical protein [Larkinella soli]
MAKSKVILLQINFLLFTLYNNCDKVFSEIIFFRFAGEKWKFPLTVEEAVKKYRLFFSPPGYYYLEDKKCGYNLSIDFHSEERDFENEFQPKEVLFARKIHTYIFQFRDSGLTMDSLITVVEHDFKRRFVLQSDTNRFGNEPLPEPLKKVLPGHGIVEYRTLQANPNLTVGIRRKPAFNREDKFVEVIFFYDLPKEKIQSRMMAY